MSLPFECAHEIDPMCADCADTLYATEACAVADEISLRIKTISGRENDGASKG